MSQQPSKSEPESFAHALTVDLEPWTTSGSALFGHLNGIDESDWSVRRLQENVDRLRRLLDEHHTRATFFVLGSVAKRAPECARQLGQERIGK